MSVQLCESVRIQSVWKTESALLVWLVSDQGLEFLAAALRFEIEEPQREARAGDYCCGIVGKLAGNTDRVVVIENQFGKTDHDNLGKLLTHVAVHKAVTAIWIAERVSDDHRATVDWLNENTPPTLGFYVAELEASRIGDSPVAPRLKVVCQPNITMKATGSAGSQNEQWYLSYWTEIIEALAATEPPLHLPKPSTSNWLPIATGKFGLGKSRFGLCGVMTPKMSCVRVELYIGASWKDAAFEAIEAQKDGIEAEVGHALQWFPTVGKSGARVLLEHYLDPEPDENRPKVCVWFAHTVPVMYRAFRARIAQLQEPC